MFIKDYASSLSWSTPPKTNIFPEKKKWLEGYLPFEMVPFQGTFRTIPIFNWKYIFKRWMFHCHLSFPWGGGHPFFFQSLLHLQVTNGSASVASALKPKRSIMLDQCERPGSWIQKKRRPRGNKKITCNLEVVNNHGDRKSPKWGCGTPSKWPTCFINAGFAN